MLLKTARKVVIAIVGGTVVLFGIVLLVTPGPGMVVIPIGIAILATEFAFAARWLRKLRRQGQALADRAGFTSRKRRSGPPPSSPGSATGEPDSD